jgi:hypothetical protein
MFTLGVSFLGFVQGTGTEASSSKRQEGERKEGKIQVTSNELSCDGEEKGKDGE